VTNSTGIELMTQVLRAQANLQALSTIATRKPVRVTATLSWSTYQQLVTRSTEEGRSVSNLMAYILESHL
jgi:hypothetical protein